MKLRSVVFTGAGALLVMLSTACADDGGSNGGGGDAGGTAVTTGGHYRGTYEVPVGPDLAAAAVYDVAEVEWTITSGVVKLEYDLPLGLVGKQLRVEFTGPIDVAGGTASLLGPPGDAACDVATAKVSCTEQMKGLLPVNPDLAVVEQVAQAEMPGAVSQRLDVAKQFSVDPIGIVHIDLTAPVAAEPIEPEKPEKPES